MRSRENRERETYCLCVCAHTCVSVHIHRYACIYLYMHIHIQIIYVCNICIYMYVIYVCNYIQIITKKETTTNHNSETKNQRRACPMPPQEPCTSQYKEGNFCRFTRSRNTHEPGELNSAWITGVIKGPPPTELYQRVPQQIEGGKVEAVTDFIFCGQ